LQEHINPGRYGIKTVLKVKIVLIFTTEIQVLARKILDTDVANPGNTQINIVAKRNGFKYDLIISKFQ